MTSSWIHVKPWPPSPQNEDKRSGPSRKTRLLFGKEQATPGKRTTPIHTPRPEFPPRTGGWFGFGVWHRFDRLVGGASSGQAAFIRGGSIVWCVVYDRGLGHRKKKRKRQGPAPPKGWFIDPPRKIHLHPITTLWVVLGCNNTSQISTGLFHGGEGSSMIHGALFVGIGSHPQGPLRRLPKRGPNRSQPF